MNLGTIKSIQIGSARCCFLLLTFAFSVSSFGQSTSCAGAAAGAAFPSGTCLTNQNATTAVAAANCGGGFNSGVGFFYKFVAGSCNQFDITFNALEEVQFNLWTAGCGLITASCQGDAQANTPISQSYGTVANTGTPAPLLVPGTTYIFEVVTNTNSNFSICFNANMPEAPSNECAGAAGLGPTPTTLYNGGNCQYTGSLYDATTTDPAPASLCAGSLENTQWSTFQPVAGTSSIQIVGGNIACGGPICKWQFGIFSGSCASLTPEGCVSSGNACANGPDPSSATTTPAGGNNNFLVTWNSITTGSFTGTITPNPGPTFTGAEVFYLVMDGNANSDCQYQLSGVNVVPLPIELIHFYSMEYSNANMLIWEVTSELNNDRFEIERSTNGRDWTNVSIILGAGTSDQQRKYSIIDENFERMINYYRIAQYDYDGKVTYSKMIAVDNSIEINREIVSIFNLMGQEVEMSYEGLKLVKYSDGTSEKVY